MTAKNFEKSLRAFQRRKPFRPFRIRFVDGEYIDVHHPEAVMISGSVAVYFDRQHIPTLFDHEGVSGVSGETERQTA
jgi:hypothetical protein